MISRDSGEDLDGKNQCGPKKSRSSTSVIMGSRAAVIELLLPPTFLTSSYHFLYDWYLGHRSRSSPNGSERNSI